MDDLQKIQGAAALQRADQPAQLQTISSPLRDHLSTWQLALGSHPDKDFISYILEGINCGFRVGFNYSIFLCPVLHNTPSTKDHGEVIETYLAGEVPTGRIIGPLSSSTTSKVKLQINCLGVVPKGRASSKWRLIITDLLFQEGRTMNDDIDPLVCSLSYTTVNKVHVVQVAGRLGVGTLFANWMSALCTALSRCTQTTIRYLVSSGRVSSTWTACSLLDCVWQQRFSPLLPLSLSGWHARGVCQRSTIT